MHHLNISFKPIAALAVILSAFSPLAPVRAAAQPGELVRGSTAGVYYVGADQRRYVFPNEKTYFTWYGDFSPVRLIADSELAALPIGGNVSYRPGVRLVKIESDPRVYAVSGGGVLRWVPSETAAASLYGPGWSRLVDDIPVSFFSVYKTGDDITVSPVYDRAKETQDAASISLDLNRRMTLAPYIQSSGAGSGTLRLIGKDIRDATGRTIIARGPEMVVADTDDSRWIDAAAREGANAVRLLLTLDTVNRMTPETFDALVGQAVSHGMIVWISLYTWDEKNDYVIGSALGGGNFYSLKAPEGTGICSKATPMPCYLAVWSRPWLKALAAKYKANVIVDAMQEYIGTANPDTDAGRDEWASASKAHVKWFRSAGYAGPLEIMSSFQGRDLAAIIEKGASIRAADTLVVDGHAQTMFGWQAYWAADWYKSWQGELLLGKGKTITGVQAIHQFVASQDFPIEVGFDNYAGDTGSEYKAQIEQAATDGVSWLWWSWRDSGLECPVDGAVCQDFVSGSEAGFAGAVRLIHTSPYPLLP
jgi:hypothetical protein